MTTLIGSLGAALVLIAFILSQFHVWKDTDFKYDFLNFVGSVFLIIYAILLKSYPFLILNTIWGLVSLKDVIKRIA